MAIGRISGSVLKANLTRNGTDLAFETNLLYLDVTNSRIGIGTSSPATELDVSGTVTSTAAGDGGAGVTTSIDGTPTPRAGGGGGGVAWNNSYGCGGAGGGDVSPTPDVLPDGGTGVIILRMLVFGQPELNTIY